MGPWVDVQKLPALVHANAGVGNALSDSVHIGFALDTAPRAMLMVKARDVFALVRGALRGLLQGDAPRFQPLDGGKDSRYEAAHHVFVCCAASYTQNGLDQVFFVFGAIGGNQSQPPRSLEKARAREKRPLAGKHDGSYVCACGACVFAEAGHCRIFVFAQRFYCAQCSACSCDSRPYDQDFCMNFGIHSSSFSFVVRQGLWCSVRVRRTRRRIRAAAPAHISQGMPPAPVPAAAASAPVAPAVPVAPVVRPRPCPPASHPQCRPSCTSACSPAGAHTCGRRACRVPVAPAPAADTFAVMCFVKSNVSR